MSSESPGSEAVPPAVKTPLNKLPGIPQYFPILIIPGFMSSGLKIQESNVCPSWQGRRVWCNLASLGMSSIHFRGAQKIKAKNEGATEPGEMEEIEQERYKSLWLEHMRLDPEDMRSDPSGIKVRPMSGLEGVDYLTPGAFTSRLSYVFGPVITALKKEGYIEDVNLRAAPYDWRLPPTELEQRDQYFSRTINQVEELLYNNHSLPVVLVSHSLGCRVAHYFLNFCLKRKGQAWIDKHIHTYIPIGGPHLGAPKVLRGVISVEKMGLDRFLDDEEALVLSRSFGSTPWLLPKDLPPGVPSSVYICPHGVLEISFESGVDAQIMFEKEVRTKRFQMIVACGTRHKVNTKFATADSGTGIVWFHEKISFATDSRPRSLEERTVQFFLQESSNLPSCSCNMSFICFLKAITGISILQYICRVIRFLTLGVIIFSINAMTSRVSTGTNLAFSEPLVIPSEVWEGSSAMSTVTLYHKDDYEPLEGHCCYPVMSQPRTTELRIKMRWVPFSMTSSCRKICSPVCRPVICHGTQSDPLDISKDNRNYHESTGYDIIEREGLTNMLHLIRDVYDKDSVHGPRDLSSNDAPPVKRVHAIYGINLQTEVGAVYERRDICTRDDESTNLHKLASKARISSRSGYKCVGGVLMETKHTRQVVDGGRKVSGDGAVPYWSLHHCKTWEAPGREVTVVELERAEHRDILADSRLHAALLEYCRIEKPRTPKHAMRTSNTGRSGHEKFLFATVRKSVAQSLW